MRKTVILLLTFLLLCPAPAAAAEAPQYIALAFEGCPEGEGGQLLLTGLAERNVRATFFLGAAPWERGQQILRGGHEIGLLAPDLSALSRREIHRELSAIRALLPGCRVGLLRSHGTLSDGARQVAKAQGLSILESTLDPWAEVSLGRTVLQRVKPGDVLLISGETKAALILNLVDILQNRGFFPVTVSELGRMDLTERSFGAIIPPGDSKCKTQSKNN